MGDMPLAHFSVNKIDQQAVSQSVTKINHETIMIYGYLTLGTHQKKNDLLKNNESSSASSSSQLETQDFLFLNLFIETTQLQHQIGHIFQYDNEEQGIVVYGGRYLDRIILFVLALDDHGESRVYFEGLIRYFLQFSKDWDVFGYNSSIFEQKDPFQQSCEKIFTHIREGIEFGSVLLIEKTQGNFISLVDDLEPCMLSLLPGEYKLK